MSRIRLYEIAKELGKESKEVVARAKELGLEVKSHSSSVEEEAGQRIKASFAAKEVAKPLPEKEAAVQPAPKKVAEKPAAPVQKEAAPAKKEEPKVAEAVTTEAPAKPAPARPQSRNFKAEREARAKEQAERRSSNKIGNHKILTRRKVMSVIVMTARPTTIAKSAAMTVVIIVVKIAVGMVRIIKDSTVKTANSLRVRKLTLRLGQQL